MHSLVIDGWPFYIGLGIIVTHLSFYWLDKWLKYRREMNNSTNKYASADITAYLLIMNMHKKLKNLEISVNETREFTSELCSLIDKLDIKSCNCDHREAIPPEQSIKKKYIMRKDD